MNQRDRRLRREIFRVVVIKILAITALWWCFVRDARVSVDSPAAAEHLGTAHQESTHARRSQ